MKRTRHPPRRTAEALTHSCGEFPRASIRLARLTIFGQKRIARYESETGTSIGFPPHDREALRCCGDSLEKYGGHEMAAGLAIRRDKFTVFQTAFQQCARSLLDAEALRPRLQLHAELALDDLSFEFLSHHDSLQPFGAGNVQPTFMARRVTPVGEPRVLKEKHLRIVFAQNGRMHPAIYFNGAAEKLPPPPWDIAFTVERNEYEERVTAQIQIAAVRAAG